MAAAPAEDIDLRTFLNRVDPTFGELYCAKLTGEGWNTVDDLDESLKGRHLFGLVLTM